MIPPLLSNIAMYVLFVWCGAQLLFSGYRVKQKIVELVLTEAWWKQKSHELQLARDHGHIKRERVKAWKKREWMRQYKLLRVMGVWRYLTRPDLHKKFEDFFPPEAYPYPEDLSAAKKKVKGAKALPSPTSASAATIGTIGGEGTGEAPPPASSPTKNSPTQMAATGSSRSPPSNKLNDCSGSSRADSPASSRLPGAAQPANNSPTGDIITISPKSSSGGEGVRRIARAPLGSSNNIRTGSSRLINSGGPASPKSPIRTAKIRPIDSSNK